MDGVSDRDYESHVTRYHVNQLSKGPEQWSVFTSAQNLPAVLNDPSRGKQNNFFTKKWGDSFIEKTNINTSSVLPEIEWNHFEVYMKKIGKRYRRHTRFAQAINLDQEAISPSTSHNRFYNELSDINLSDIPQIFLKQNLELYNPVTFSSVFPGISESDQSGRLQQEKLSYYLDIVEVQIAKQVSQKSSAFFNAMTSQDTIMEQMNVAAVNVKLLRSRIRHIDNDVVKNSLKIVSMERSRTHHHLVLEKLKLMRTVHQTQPTIQLLLSTQDYVAALDLIGTTQEILTQELSGVHCFRHLPSQLTEMERLIDKMLSTDFERYSTADLNRPLTCDKGGDKVLEKDKLVCIISGLLRKGQFNFIETYKEEAIVTVKALVKQMMIEVIASSDFEICLTGAGEEAQSLSLTEWINLLETATDTLLKLLKRVKAVYDVMQLTSAASAGKLSHELEYLDSEVFLTEAEHLIVQTKLIDLIQSVCNYCHERCANLVSNQSLEKSTATLQQIEELNVIVDEFSQGCFEICGIHSVPLKSALKAQGTKFAQKFHSERKSKLSLLLDSERWKQADVPAEFQKIIDHISKDDFLWTKTEDGLSILPSPVLIVDGQPFALVGAALILVQIVSEYCRCATQLPVISIQLSRNVIDLLRTFNSRCCQLVLGAGALHVAGLKTITSGNLALVSRALQLVLWLLPHVKNHFQNLEENGATLIGYETVEKDFISHIKEIENKVLSIVFTIVGNQIMNWDARPPIPSQSFRNISRQFVKLHEAIGPILPEEQIHRIYRTVHENFKDKLREQLLKNNIINNGGPQHGVVTSELTFYLETLRTLNAMPAEELLDDTLNNIWLKF